jgi:AP-1 complex subunit gamma-1
VIHASISEND